MSKLNCGNRRDFSQFEKQTFKAFKDKMEELADDGTMVKLDTLQEENIIRKYKINQRGNSEGFFLGIRCTHDEVSGKHKMDMHPDREDDINSEFFVSEVNIQVQEDLNPKVMFIGYWKRSKLTSNKSGMQKVLVWEKPRRGGKGNTVWLNKYPGQVYLQGVEKKQVSVNKLNFVVQNMIAQFATLQDQFRRLVRPNSEMAAALPLLLECGKKGSEADFKKCVEGKNLDQKQFVKGITNTGGYDTLWKTLQEGNEKKLSC